MTDRPSTEALWAHLSADLRRFIRRRVTDDHVAEDLLQETFVRAHHHLPTLEEVDRVAAWMYRIARNVVHDHHRSAANAAVSLVEADPPEPPDDAVALLRREAAGWLDEMIQALPDGYREAVQLFEIEGLSQQEVADRLGLTLSGAKSRVQRGRAMLKGVLEGCCRFEFDARGNVRDYHPRSERRVCDDCGE
jgi:RNA polymerase sigma-70 factor (ECF subfamily)